MNEHPSRPFGEAANAADAAIDRAVREIMSGEPRPGFRQRVLARLDEEPRSVWSWARLGLVAGAAAIVLLTLWARTDRPVAPAGTAPQQAASQPQPGPSKPAAAAPTEPQRPAATLATNETKRTTVKPERPAIVRRAPPAPADRRVSAASVNPAEETQEPGVRATRPPIAPMTIAPLQIRPLDTPELIVRPVPIGPLQMVPVPRPR
jgi:hypothetical protein